MKKQMILMVIAVGLILSSCFIDKSTQHKSAVCTLKEDKSTIKVSAEFDEEEIMQVISVDFEQQFTKEMVSDMSEDEVIRTLTAIFTENGNENIKAKVTYNKKTRVGEVHLDVPISNLSAAKLESYNLNKENKIADFMKSMKDKNFECGVKE